MKKTGYDQFFKQARANSGATAPRRPVEKSRFELNHSHQTSEKNTQQSLLAEQLRTRLQASKKKKPKKSLSWKFAGISFLGVVLTSAGYLEHERIENFLRRVEISFLGSAMAESEKAAVEQKPSGEIPGEKVAANSPAEGGEKKEEVAKKRDFTDEEINHFSKLNERKRELDAREEELARMEAELAAQKTDLEKRLQKLETTRREISSVLEEKVKADDQKVETLVQMYSNMKPQQAAKIFEEMDEDLAVEIIGRMKKKNAAEVMNIIKPEKAKVFAEKFAGYKRD